MSRKNVVSSNKEEIPEAVENTESLEETVSNPPTESVKEEVEPKLEDEVKLVKIVYLGNAHHFKIGQFDIRPGEPVLVPSDIAENCLTYPYERFMKVEE